MEESGERCMTHDESHPLSNGGLTCFCCKDLYFCTVCNDNIARSKINQKERKDNLDELLWAITSIAKQDPCETVGHWACANALRAVVEVVKSYSDGQAYVNEEFNQGLQTTLLLIVNAIEKEIHNEHVKV
jgi:hypothetical protein